MGRDSLEQLAESIRTHPRFDEAARRLVRDLIGWRIRLGVLNKIVTNLGRERIIEHLLHLHYARGSQVAKHGATFERLAELSDVRDGFGARAVRTALRLALIGGMVTLARSHEDGRLRIFEPTEALLASTREFFAIQAGVFDVLLQDESVSRRLREDSHFLPAMLARSADAYLSEQPRKVLADDAFASLLRLEGGRAVLLATIDCFWGRQDMPATSELSQRFYASPSQVRVILKSANSAGLIKLGPRGRLLDAAPLADIYGRTQSRYLAFLARHTLRLEDRILSSLRGEV
jgi:hypothetical protein